MRAVVTRVSSASVEIAGEIAGQIERGFLVLIGVAPADSEKQAEYLADRITGLRVFEDENGKMNLSLSQVGGKLLLVPNFTLYANCAQGRRPDFLAAARPETAVPLWEHFKNECAKRGCDIQCGVFGADMKVASVNDGPVTLVLDTDIMTKK